MNTQEVRRNVIENYLDNPNHFLYPTRMAPTAELATKIVSALTDVTPLDEIFFVDHEHPFKGFVYVIPQGGYNKYTGILVKPYGAGRARVTVVNNWNTADEEVLESTLVSIDDVMATFIANLYHYA